MVCSDGPWGQWYRRGGCNGGGRGGVAARDVAPEMHEEAEAIAEDEEVLVLGTRTCSLQWQHHEHDCDLGRYGPDMVHVGMPMPGMWC